MNLNNIIACSLEMPCERRFEGRRHSDSKKCQKCGKKNCNMFHCSEEYRNFYSINEELQLDLKYLMVSIKEALEKDSHNL